MSGRLPNISDAILSLAPDAEWSIEDESLEKIVWHKKPEVIPSNDEIKNELERLVLEFNNKELEKDSHRISALKKLKNFGLTEDEARAVIGF